MSFSFAQYGANTPCEDQFSFEHDEGLRMSFACVFDGHGGVLAAKFAKAHLIPILKRRLSPTSSPAEVCPAVGWRTCVGVTGRVGCTQIVAALKFAFVECDESFLGSLSCAVPNSTHSLRGIINAGCCALVAVVKNGVVYVANAGDCRAVLGQSEGPYGTGAGC